MNRSTGRRLAADGALALLFAAAAFLEAAGHGDGGFRGTAPPLLAGLVASLGPLPLVLRRRRPIAALAGVAVLTTFPHLVVSYDVVLLGGLAPLVVAAEASARYGRRPANRWSLLLPLPGLAVLALAVPGFVGTVVVSAALIMAGWAFGVLIRARLDARMALRRELDARRETEALLLDQAVTAERSRIARDLHDVIAHCVSVMVLQAGAARLRLEIDPDGSRESIERIEEVGREALVELQRVLGLLRGDDADGASVTSLERLVDDVRKAGLTVRFVLDGDLAALPPGLERSLYRVVQECLTNALKHAGDAEAELRLSVSGARVELEVENAAAVRRSGLPGGNGQVGMRERVMAYGGDLSAGEEAGRYRVRAVVPLGTPA